jgi:hypothetical protein
MHVRGANRSSRDLHVASPPSCIAAVWQRWPAKRVHFAPHIEVLEPDHLERRFVAALCLYSHAVDTGRAV